MDYSFGSKFLLKEGINYSICEAFWKTVTFLDRFQMFDFQIQSKVVTYKFKSTIE